MIEEERAGPAMIAARAAQQVVLARTRRDDGWTVARSIRGSLDVSCLILFVPYMFYWNLIGYHF